MIVKWRIKDIRITFTIAKITDVVGVNSNTRDGKHILMWDFDDTRIEDVIMSLGKIQCKHKLPDIYIYETKHNSNYIAFCFKKMSWLKALSIVAETDYVDSNFVKFSAYREHFTLRITPKQGRRLKLHTILKGFTESDATVKDLTSFTKYETLDDNHFLSGLQFLLGKEE